MLRGTAVREDEVSKTELIKKAVDTLNHAMELLSLKEMIEPSTEEEHIHQFMKMEASRLFANSLLDTNIELTEHGYVVAEESAQ